MQYEKDWQTDIHLRVQDGADKAATTLKRWGIAVIHDYLTAEQAARMNREHQDLMEAGDIATIDLDFGNGLCRNVKFDTLKEMPERFRTWIECYDSEFLRETISRYLRACSSRPEDTPLNDRFEVEHNTAPGWSVASGLHYDRVGALKTALYVEDTDRHNGALRAIPGTHVLARSLAEKQFRDNVNPLFQKNFVRNEEDFSPVWLELPAGTLILLDTFCLHAGGAVDAGRSRRTIRGVTWLRPMNARMLSDPLPDFAGQRPSLPVMPDMFHPHPVDPDIKVHEDSLYHPGY